MKMVDTRFFIKKAERYLALADTLSLYIMELFHNAFFYANVHYLAKNSTLKERRPFVC